jgi:succinyl-diaminopimelate desuccinylase
MTRTGEQVAALEAAARQDSASVLELTRDLVRIPSRGGIDPYDPVLDCMACWLDSRGLECRRLTGPGGATVALACEAAGAVPGPRVAAALMRVSATTTTRPCGSSLR